MKILSIQASDQYPLIITRFDPVSDSGSVVLINSATAVKQTFYYDFATYLAAHGYQVYTYDYRGIGRSRPEKLKGFKATMSDWAQKDFPALVTYIREQHPASRLYLIGHSFGGSCLGMSKLTNAFSAILTVGAQYGYWKYFQQKKQPFLAALWYVIIPLLSRGYGYFPSRLVGMGQDLPKGAALEWAKVCRNPNWVFDYIPSGQNQYPHISRPILAISIEDDWMAPQKAVDKLHLECYTAASVERKHIRLQDIGARAIGHFDFFRKKFSDTLWPISLDWMNRHAKAGISNL